MDLSLIDVASKAAGVLGFLVSVTLAIIKVLEIHRDRFRLEALCTLTSDEYIGNKITLINPTSRPIIVSWWHLRWKTKKFPFRKITKYEIDIGDPLDDQIFRIDSYSSYDLKFKNEDHFGWGNNMSKHGRLYIDLTIAGTGRTISLEVYNPTA